MQFICGLLYICENEVLCSVGANNFKTFSQACADFEIPLVLQHGIKQLPITSLLRKCTQRIVFRHRRFKLNATLVKLLVILTPVCWLKNVDS
jgi:hypothetical protein